MRLFGHASKVEAPPDWRLSITPGLREEPEQTIDGVRVVFDKVCWTWNIIREDLRGQGGSWWWDSGIADTREEALEIGLKKMKKAQRNHSAKTKLGVK